MQDLLNGLSVEKYKDILTEESFRHANIIIEKANNEK